MCDRAKGEGRVRGSLDSIRRGRPSVSSNNAAATGTVRESVRTRQREDERRWQRNCNCKRDCVQ